ncbi:MAG: biopolymer transporter ExbD [Kofleriaceae bacterium]|nr:biopolymer transporter ExbD [Kofleriaceae bacterium]
MSTGGGGKGAVQSEINVTPLIDVLLVLLIIFMVVMPVMMKMETLQVPRKIEENEQPDQNASMLTLKVLRDLTVQFSDGLSETPLVIQHSDIQRTLRPKLEAMSNSATAEKVVFVDFEDEVPWSEVVSTMDSIRGLAADVNHDEIKVALKVKEDAAPAQ